MSGPKAISASILILASVTCLLQAAGQGVNDSAGSIVVQITGVRSEEGGDLIVSLYDSREKWLKIEDARITEVVKADADSIEVEFDDLPYDSIYAVAVVHDKNLNGKLDMRRFPWPRLEEGAGVSNNEFGFGRPDYEDAVLKLASPLLEIQIYMRY